MFTRHDRKARIRQTPAVDVLPTDAGQGHQEFIVGDDAGDSTLTKAMSQCEQFGLSRDQAARQVSDAIAVVDNWKEQFRTAGVSDGDVDSLAERIDEGDLGAQRARTSSLRTSQTIANSARRRQRPFA